MFCGILHRTILLELFKVFSIALVALTGLLLLAGVIAEAMQSGLGPTQILTVIPLLLPSMLPYTVPTTTLFATCMVYGRLSADNELVALKAAGIHVVHVIWPAMFLGAAATALTLFLSLDTIPYTHFLLRSQVASDVEELLYNMLRKDGCLKHPKMNYVIHAKSIHGRTLYDAQFMRRSKSGTGFDTVVWAKEAELIVDLLHQQVIVDMRRCNFEQDNGTVGFLERRVWPFDLPGELDGTFVKSRASDMTWNELGEYRQQWHSQRAVISREIDKHQLAITLGRAPPHFAKHVRSKIRERKNLDQQIFAIEAEYHLRLTLALGCFCFALVGCPIGIWFSRSDYLSAFVTCFLPIVTIYYPVLLCMINVTRNGAVPPFLALYNANAMMLLTGVVLFRRLARS